MVQISRKDLIWCFFLLLSITGYAQPVADFSSDIISGCSPLTVNFMDKSTGNPSSWQWDLGNGNKPVIQNPSAIYIDPGTYNVKLTVSNGTQLSTVTKQIIVFKNPAATFSASDTFGCLPLTVNFSDISIQGSAPVKSRFWDFGDGSNSTQANPSHTYTQAGKYQLSLIVVDQNNCKNTKSIPNYITIAGSSNTKLQFTGNATAGCDLPYKVDFDNTSIGTGLNYTWNFGDGSSSSAVSPTHLYNSIGTYSVTLTAKNASGCTDQLKKNNYIQVQPKPTVNFSVNKTQLCISEVAAFTDLSSSGNSWKWDFGDGITSTSRNPFHSYSQSGAYTIKLLIGYGNNCWDSISKTNYINVSPSSTQFTADITDACSLPVTVNFSDQSANPVSWQWDFGDGTTSAVANPSHTYTSFGNFSVKLITGNNMNSCKDTLLRTQFIKVQKPEAKFGAFPRKGCLPLTVAFKDSSITNEPVQSWEWDFGDGSTVSNQQNPTHVYTSENQFNVRLVITTISGCKDTLFMPGYVRAGNKPTFIDFAVDKTSICAYEYVSFTDLSVHSNEWFWDIGKFGTDSTQNLYRQPTDTGYVDIKFVAAYNGCADSIAKTRVIYINPPVSRFNVFLNCSSPYKVGIADTSIGALQYDWNFGDGQTSATIGDTIYHTYAAGGLKTIRLITTNNGCKDTASTDITIGNFKAAFSSITNKGCAPSPITFTDQSTNAGTWEWDFGDGSTATQQNPVHTYQDTGVYSVKLTVTDKTTGCADSIVKMNYVQIGQLIADFEVDTTYGCFPLMVQFKDLSQPVGGISAWEWDFGDGTKSTLPHPPAHQYNVKQTFPVTLIVKTANCADTVTYNNAVQFPNDPDASFLISDTLTCKKTTVSFDAKQKNYVAYNWDFGDGNKGTSSAVSNEYTLDGTYIVALTVTNSIGCTSSYTDTLRIADPVADFSATPTFASCPDLLSDFTDLSSPNAVKWDWDLGNGNTSSLRNPSNLYTNSDSFDVKLTITTRLGCTATILKKDFIQVSGPTGDFSFFPKKGCPPLDVNFISNAKNISKYQWDFGGAGALGSGAQTTFTYNLANTYKPRLILTDNNGCVLSFQSPDSIVVKDLLVEAGVDKYICKGDSVILNGSGEGSTFSWSPSGGINNPSAPEIFVKPVATTTYYFSTFSGKCFNKDSVTIHVNPFIPSAGFSATRVCFRDTTVFTNTTSIPAGGVISTYKWNITTTDSTSVKDTLFRFNAPGQYQVKLTAVTDSGCKSSIIKTVIIDTLPKADFSSATICDKGTATFTSLSKDSIGITSLNWDLGDGVKTTGTLINHVYPDTGWYNVQLIALAQTGCRDTITKAIFVNPNPAPQFNSTKAACLKGPIQFTDESTVARGKITSWTWNLGDGVKVQEQNPSYVYKNLGKFDVSLLVVSDSSCSASASKAAEASIYPIPEANFSVTVKSRKVLDNWWEFKNSSKDAISYKWYFGDGDSSMLSNPSHTYQDSGHYVVTLIAIGQNQCADTLRYKEIYVEPGYAFYIPNAFSPNDDGKNDGFSGKGFGIQKFRMDILDRWGNLVFSTTDVNQAWDGKLSSGEPAQIDVYVYKAIVRDIYLVQHIYVGKVTLIR